MDPLFHLQLLLDKHSLPPEFLKEMESILNSLKKDSHKKSFVIARLQENKTITENFLNKTVQELEEKNTELQTIAEEMQRANEQLVSINKELEQFAYIISHDLQEPLRTILDFTDLLNRKKADILDEKTKTYLGFIAQSSTHMSKLIRAILDYSVIGKTGEKQMIDCGLLIQEVIQNLSSVIEEKQAKIHVAPMPEVFGLEYELRSLFQNLISNALKYAKEELPAEILISCESRGAFWKFAIQDNGIGFDPKYADRIFVIFQRLHNPGVRKGSGIGLSQCKKIVELHEGKIWVETQPNVGSTFYFILPNRKME